MAVELGLPDRARDDGQIVALCASKPEYQIHEPLEDHRLAMGRPHRQEPQLADTPAGGKVRIHVLELLIERKRPLAADRNHPDDVVALDGNEVGILVVEAIDMAPVWTGAVLWNLLHERLVSEPENLLVFRRVGGNPELDRAGARHDECGIITGYEGTSRGAGADSGKVGRRTSYHC